MDENNCDFVYLADEDSIENHIKRLGTSLIEWYYTSIMAELSDNFIRKYNTCIVWVWISRCQVLSVPIMCDYCHKIVWTEAFRTQILSEDFIEAILGF